MAEFGANYPCFKANGATSGVVLGKLVSADLTVNLASGELYADDSLAEQLAEFASGSIAMQTDDLEDDKASAVYGCAVSNNEVTYNKSDTPPLGCLAYYKVLMRNGSRFYKGYYYPQVRAAIGNDSAKTRGNSITFSTANTAFTVFADDSGEWRKTKTSAALSDIKSWIDGKCGIASTP